jgi:hypothetical protein
VDAVGSVIEYGETATLFKPVTLIGKVDPPGPVVAGWVILPEVKPAGTEIFRTPPAGAIKPKPVPTYTRPHALLVPLFCGICGLDTR